MDAALLPALHDALVVAQTSSVGEAARRLHKTPSAVSQQLRRIEEHFDVRAVREGRAGASASARRARRRWGPSPGCSTRRRRWDLAGRAGERAGDHPARGRQRLPGRGPAAAGDAASCSPRRCRCTSRSPPPTRPRRRRLVADGQVDVAHGQRAIAREPAADDDPALPRSPSSGWRPAQRPARVGPMAGHGWRASRCCACCPAARGGGFWTSTSAACASGPLSTIDLPSVSLMLSYARRGWASAWRPSWRWRETTAGWRSNAPTCRRSTSG